MVLCRKGRFYVEGASFAIPDGFYLVTTPDLCYDTGLCARDPTRSHLYIWATIDEQVGTREELEALPHLGCQLLSECTPVTANGLSGHWLIWTMTGNGCYEARFDLGNGRHFMLMVDACKCDIHEIIASSEFKAVLEGIRKETT